MGSNQRPEQERTRWGINLDGSFTVRRGETEYRVTQKPGLHEWTQDDYDVELVAGPDVLDHGEVRWCAHDAALDAFGAN